MKSCAECKYRRHMVVTMTDYCGHYYATVHDRIRGDLMPKITDEITTKCDQDGWFETGKQSWFIRLMGG